MRNISEVTKGVVPELLNFLNAGVYITDANRTIVFWNRMAEEITGYKAEQVLGKCCKDNLLVHEDKEGNPLCTTEMCPLYQSMKKGVPTEAPVLVFAKTASGERIPVSTAVAPIHDSDGKVIGGVEVFRDERENVAQMELARAVQRQMLAAVKPRSEHISFALRYSPLEVVGGDFYHAAPVSDDVYAVFIADVMGHGPSAALYTAMLHSVVMECDGMRGYPGAFVSAVNDRLCERVPQTVFVTAAAATLSASEGSLTYCSAGHPQALLQPAGSELPEVLDCGNFPLGIEKGAHFRAREFSIARGDRFLLYTDGVTEIRVGQEERLGVEGLVAVVAECPPEGPQHGLDRLFDLLMARNVVPFQEDDITLLSCIVL